MRKIEFLEKACVGVQVLSDKLTDKTDIFMYTASQLQFGRQMSNGKFKLVTEDELAKEYLENGKGVCYKGYIYFQEDKATNSESFKKFANKLQRMTNELNRKVDTEYQMYLNGTLYSAIREISHFSMVKSMISLYQTGTFSLEMLEGKLSTYLKPEGIQMVLNELNPSVKKAG